MVNPSGRVGLDIRRQDVFCGGPNVRKHPDDRLELHTPTADLPSIFRRLHQLEVRGGCECIQRYLKSLVLC